MAETTPETTPIRALWHLLVASVVVPLGLFAFLAWYSYGTTLAEVDRRVLQNTAILHSNAQNVFELNSMVLARIDDYLSHREGAPTHEPTPDEIRRFLLKVQNESPSIHLLWVIDAEGRIVATTAPITPPTGPVLANRDSFLHHQSHQDTALFITRPLVGPVFGEQFAMTKRLSGPDGAFRGMLISVLLTQRFVDNWKRIDPELQSTVSLVREDGTILVRNPPVPVDTPPLPPDSPVMRALRAAPSGLFKPISPVDGRVRITGFRKLDGVPVWIAHSVALPAVVALWTRTLLTYGLLCGSASLALVATGLLAHYQSRKVQSLTRYLAESKANLEHRVADRTAELGQALRQRDLLLREVYHRVKNKLQIVDSLMLLESRRLADPEAKSSIANLRSRIYALGLMHQHLMLSDDLETLDIATLLHELVDSMVASFDLEGRGLAVTVQVQPAKVDLDFATPIGLIVTELVMNAVKYAQGATTLTVAFHPNGDGTAQLVVSDNGQPPPSGELPPALPSSGSGTKIVDSLVRQLSGRLHVSYDKGRRIEVSVPFAEIPPC